MTLKRKLIQCAARHIVNISNIGLSRTNITDRFVACLMLVDQVFSF